MNDISNIKNKHIENDTSKVILNNSKNNDIYKEKKYSLNNQNMLNDSLSLNSKLIDNEINSNLFSSTNKNFKKHQMLNSNEILLSDYSNLSLLNHSFQYLPKNEIEISNNKKRVKFRLNPIENYKFKNNKQNDNINKKNYIKNTELFSLTYHSSFNLNTSNLSKKILTENQKLNELYNYGESLTKELKESNDKNTELLMKYNTLKAEFQVKENQNKELEKKIKQLKHVHVDINKSNQELNQNISSVKKIVKNSKLSSQKSILESKNQLDSNKKKLNELYIINSNLLNEQKEYENEIIRLQKILKDLKKDEIDFYFNQINIENKNTNEEEIDFLKEIEELKTTNSNLQTQIEQIKNENNILFIPNNNDKYSLDEIIKKLQNQNNEYIIEIKDIQKQFDIKNMKIKESKKEIEKLNHNLEMIEEENKKKEEYLYLKNKNNENIEKMKQLDEEIKTMTMNLSKIKNEYNEDINKLNQIYLSKKDYINKKEIEKEIKEMIEDNENIKRENNEILKSLENLTNLNNEYEKLAKINSQLKKNL